MANLAAPATEVFQILQSFDYTVMLYDEEGNRVEDPAEARRLFARPEDILVSMIEDGENSTIRLLIGKKTEIGKIFGLIQSLRVAATKFNLLFNVKQYGKQINPKKISSSNTNVIQESKALAMITEGMYGTSRSSYLSLQEARMIVRHSAKIDESKIGARGRFVESILIENKRGERFLFPTKNLAPARAMTQHVNHKGTFDDNVGKRILCMAEDYMNLVECSRHVYRHGSTLAEGTGAIREACRGKITKLRKTFEKMYRPSGYEAEAAHINETANTLVEDIDTNVVAPDEIDEMRAALNVKGVDLNESVFESACRAMRDIDNSEAASTSLDEYANVPINLNIHPEPFVKAIKHKHHDWSLMSTDELLKLARETIKELTALSGKELMITADHVVRRLLADSETSKAVSEAIEPKTFVSVLGNRVDVDVWNQFRNSKLELHHTPVENGTPTFTSKSAELAFKLDRLVPCVKDDSMANLLGFVAERMPEERDSETLKKMRIIASAAVKAAGLMESDLAVNNPSVKSLSEWIRGFSTEHILAEDFNGDWSDDPHADDAAIADFDPDAFFNDPVVQDVIHGRCAGSDDCTIGRDEVKDALVAYLSKWVERNQGYSDDAGNMADSLMTKAVEKFEQEGFEVSDSLDEDTELTREDVLLPPNDQGLNLKREIVKKTVTDPDTGKEEEPGRGYIARLRALSGVMSGRQSNNY